LSPSGRPFCPSDGQLLAPFSLGNYQVDESLGAGGMALVFGARHKLLGKPVALKILRDAIARDADQTRRFLREAQIAACLRHENIIDIQDFGRDETVGVLYLVMERLWGLTLADLIRAEAPLPLARAVKILAPLCRALQEAHERGVVHRDLNPRNVFLIESSGRSDVVKLCDFGLSRTVSGADRVTTTGAFVGTPAYMAPEQVRGDAQQDARADLYALGVTAYEMFTGRLPFDASSPVALIANKLTGKPHKLSDSAQGASLPAALDALLAQCLADLPGNRPASAREVEQTLLALGGWSGAGSAAAPRVFDPQADPLIGAMAGSYKLVRKLGTGGAGSVYLAQHPVIGTKVAVKVLLPEVAAIQGIVDRFIREAQASSAIGNAHIPKYFDFGRLGNGLPFAAMDYIEGETLQALLARGEALAPCDVAHVIEQVADAMAAAHAVGIVHRDLKPDNLVLERHADGGLFVKVLDFGIAKLLAPDGKGSLTTAGLVLGTPLYCAPEQGLGQEVGPAADVYALGATAYELLTGTPPFVGAIGEVLSAKAIRDPRPVHALRPDVPPRLAQLVDHMIARNPDSRPPSMAAVRIAATTAAKEPWTRRDHGAAPDQVATAEPPLHARAVRRHRVWLWAVGAALGVVGGVVLAFAVVGSVGTSPDVAAPSLPAPAPADPEGARPELPPVVTPLPNRLPTAIPAPVPPRNPEAEANRDPKPAPTSDAKPAPKPRAKIPAKPKPTSGTKTKPGPKRDGDVIIVDPFQ
jgi:serine/threonine-protein kinase